MVVITPFNDIDELLRRLLYQTQQTMGRKLVSLYMYGSLVTGDFDREANDIASSTCQRPRSPALHDQSLRLPSTNRRQATRFFVTFQRVSCNAVFGRCQSTPARQVIREAQAVGIARIDSYLCHSSFSKAVMHSSLIAPSARQWYAFLRSPSSLYPKRCCMTKESLLPVKNPFSNLRRLSSSKANLIFSPKASVPYPDP